MSEPMQGDAEQLTEQVIEQALDTLNEMKPIEEQIPQPAIKKQAKFYTKLLCCMKKQIEK